MNQADIRVCQLGAAAIGNYGVAVMIRKEQPPLSVRDFPPNADVSAILALYGELALTVESMVQGICAELQEGIPAQPAGFFLDAFRKMIQGEMPPEQDHAIRWTPPTPGGGG